SERRCVGSCVVLTSRGSGTVNGQRRGAPRQAESPRRQSDTVGRGRDYPATPAVSEVDEHGAVRTVAARRGGQVEVEEGGAGGGVAELDGVGAVRLAAGRLGLRRRQGGGRRRGGSDRTGQSALVQGFDTEDGATGGHGPGLRESRADGHPEIPSARPAVKS